VNQAALVQLGHDVDRRHKDQHDQAAHVGIEQAEDWIVVRIGIHVPEDTQKLLSTVTLRSQ